MSLNSFLRNMKVLYTKLSTTTFFFEKKTIADDEKEWTFEFRLPLWTSIQLLNINHPKSWAKREG